jgi:hypothetical protein
MTRICAFGALMLLAVTGGSCGGGESAGPTSPTATPTASTPATADPAPPPSGGCSRPPAPSNFAVALSESRAVFTWSAVNGAIDYTIRVGTTSGASNVISTNTTQTTYAWNGTARGTYFATVEARNSCGSGASASWISFTTM